MLNLLDFFCLDRQRHERKRSACCCDDLHHSRNKDTPNVGVVVLRPSSPVTARPLPSPRAILRASADRAPRGVPALC